MARYAELGEIIDRTPAGHDPRTFLELFGTFEHAELSKPETISFFRNPDFVRLEDAKISLMEEYKAWIETGDPANIEFAEAKLKWAWESLAETFKEERVDPSEICQNLMRSPRQ